MGLSIPNQHHLYISITEIEKRKKRWYKVEKTYYVRKKINVVIIDNSVIFEPIFRTHLC